MKGNASQGAISKQLQELKAKKPTLLDILISSPFDDKMNIDERFTEELFYEKLHVKDEYADLRAALVETINSDLKSNTIILVSGYAGTGKTTFIKSFIKDTPAFAHHYLTFDDRSMFHSSTNTDEEVLSLIKRYLNSRRDIRDTIAFLIANRRALWSAQLVSQDLFRMTATQEALEPDDILDMITKFNIKDTFTAFFTHLFLHASSNQTTIIYFDNLDNVKLEFLSSRFLQDFQSSLVDANVLRKAGNFVSDISMNSFHFIFCLRDANGALANHHIASRTLFNVVPFNIAFRPAFYHHILNRRLDFAVALYGKEHEFGRIRLDTIDEIFKRLTEDDYFQDAFIPFFNGDYRTTVKALINILEHTRDARDFATKLSYTSRGHLLFGLVRYGLGDNYLEKYFEAQIPSRGWCYIDRVLLTVIINRSKYNRGKHRIGMSPSELSESYYLVDTIQQLERFYTVGDVLAAISRCFLYHERDWVHLLTISNLRITRLGQSDFIREYAEKYEKREGLEPADRAKLNAVKVRVNPAGFTFVRYILTHFEFYSNLVKNSGPLTLIESELDTRPEKFEFEVLIDRVIKLVEAHIKSMEQFFAERYTPVVGSPEDFYRSDYCFRHQGTANMASEQGYFHSTRIITSHINYIDHFRIKVLTDFRHRALEALQDVNARLVERVKTYIELLRASIDERAKRDFIGDFEEAIHVIESDCQKMAETRITRKKIAAPSKRPIVRQLRPK